MQHQIQYKHTKEHINLIKHRGSTKVITMKYIIWKTCQNEIVLILNIPMEYILSQSKPILEEKFSQILYIKFQEEIVM